MMVRTYFRTEQSGYVDHDFYGLAGLGDEKRTELQIRVTYDAEGRAGGQILINDEDGNFPLEESFDLTLASADLLVKVLSHGVPIE